MARILISEQEIHKQIVEYLDLVGIFCFHIPNERNSSVVNMRKLKAMGLRPGAPDLEVWIPTKSGTKVVFMEVKRADGRQSENQKLFEAKCVDYGLSYHVVRSVEDVISVIKKHQLQKRAD